jgi:hypothetical protein
MLLPFISFPRLKFKKIDPKEKSISFYQEEKFQHERDLKKWKKKERRKYIYKALREKSHERRDPNRDSVYTRASKSIVNFVRE